MHWAGEGMGAEKELLKMDLCMRETVQCFRGSKGKTPRFPIPFPEATVAHGFLCVLQKLSTLTWSFLCLSTYLFTCLGFPDVSVGKKILLHCRRHRFDSWVRKIPWRRAWQPTPVFLPGESYGQRSLVGYSPWGRKESDTTEVTERAFTCPAPFFPCIYIAHYLSIHPYKKSGIFKWMFITNRAV